MVKSNAERQREYRERRNAAARGESLGQMARDAIDSAIDDVWAIIHRPAKDGRLWGDGDSFADITAFRQYHAGAGTSHLLSLLESYVEDATPHESARLERAADLVRAVMLKHVEMPAPIKKKRGRQEG